MGRVNIGSLGCKLNQAEAQSLSRQLLALGFTLVDFAEEADICILNTCTVTHVADRKCRQWLRAARRANPHAFIIAMGCYPQHALNELANLGVADLIIGNEDKGSLAGFLASKTAVAPAFNKQEHWAGRTRCLVKIQEGCSQFCTFCIVPYTRGRGRSVAAGTVLDYVQDRVSEGYREVVLTGTLLGAYMDADHGLELPGLVLRILEKTSVERLRLSSLQPFDITPAMLELWDHDRLCPHVHMPLQSGSQGILDRMDRGYSLDDYGKSVHMLRAAVPDISITTDVITGFPGEGEAEFGESLDFCRKMDFAAIHVFPFSARSGTLAAGLPDQVDFRTKRERTRRMLALSEESARRFRRRYLDRSAKVLWEGVTPGGGWAGLTPNYLRVITKSDRDLTNQVIEVKLISDSAEGLLGELFSGG